MVFPKNAAYYPRQFQQIPIYCGTPSSKFSFDLMANSNFKTELVRFFINLILLFFFLIYAQVFSSTQKTLPPLPSRQFMSFLESPVNFSIPIPYHFFRADFLSSKCLDWVSIQFTESILLQLAVYWS